MLVRWNEPYQKLATCDADGGIFVWIQYEGRWSVELVNDRGAQVSGQDAPPGKGGGQMNETSILLLVLPVEYTTRAREGSSFLLSHCAAVVRTLQALSFN